MILRSTRKADQAGLVRGCCLGLILLIALIGSTAYFADRALAAPSLGAAPAGPYDGDTQTQIAITLGAALVAQLIHAPHGLVPLSEHDLTVLAQTHNPHPDRYTNLEVRVRSRLVVISANDQFGPFSLTPVLHLSPVLQGITAKSVALQLAQLDVGQLTLPGFIRDRFIGDLPAVLSLPSLFGAAQALNALSSNIECVAVATNGVVIGIHRPGAAPDPSTCAASGS